MSTSSKNEYHWIDEPDADTLYDRIIEDKLWGNIRRKAKTDPGLTDLLNQCIMYYELGKENKNG